MKFSVPSTCFVTISKHCKIEKLEAKYVLVAHPYPTFEGEILHIQPKKDDQEDKDLIVYRDFSLRKRLPNQEDDGGALEKQKTNKKKKEGDVSKLQCLQMQIDEPLCQAEWVNLSAVLNQVKGVAWLQLLPVGMKSSLTMQFNAVHILPESKIPYEMPIETLLKHHESNERKIVRRNLSDSVEVLDFKRHQFALTAKAQGLLVLPEFDFQHAIYRLTEGNLSSDGLVYAF